MEINFDDLEIEDSNDKPANVRRNTHKVAGTSKIDLVKMGVADRKLSVTETKQRRDELHKIEPGNKVAVLSVGRILGTWCENCGDVEMHVLKHDNSKIICMNCKQIRKLKQ